MYMDVFNGATNTVFIGRVNLLTGLTFYCGQAT